MARVETEVRPSSAPAAESWPRNELRSDIPLGLPADEMFAYQLDTGCRLGRRR